MFGGKNMLFHHECLVLALQGRTLVSLNEAHSRITSDLGFLENNFVCMYSVVAGVYVRVVMLVIRLWVFVLITSPSLRELAPVLVKNCPNQHISRVYFLLRRQIVSLVSSMMVLSESICGASWFCRLLILFGFWFFRPPSTIWSVSGIRNNHNWS